MPYYFIKLPVGQNKLRIHYYAHDCKSSIRQRLSGSKLEDQRSPTLYAYEPKSTSAFTLIIADIAKSKPTTKNNDLSWVYFLRVGRSTIYGNISCKSDSTPSCDLHYPNGKRYKKGAETELKIIIFIHSISEIIVAN